MLRGGRLGVQTLCLYLVNKQVNKICMEKIVGSTVKEALRDDYNPKTATSTARALAVAVSSVVRSNSYEGGRGTEPE